MLLALAAILCMYAGGRLLDSAWPQRFVDEGYRVRQDVQMVFSTVTPPFHSLLNHEINTFKAMTESVLTWNWSCAAA